MSNQSVNSNDSFIDSDDLINWLLLNPEVFDCGLPEFKNDSSLNDLNMEEQNNDNSFFNKDEEISYDQSFIENEQESSRKEYSFDSPKEEVVSSSNTSVCKNESPKEIKSTKKRKRESVDDLQARVNQLKTENEELQAHLLNVTQKTSEVQKQRMEMEKLMLSKLKEMDESSNSDQSELANIVKKFTDIYADYGKCRQREVAFHLDQLEKLILPTQTTKMCLWALHQDKTFYQKNKSPMYNILSNELGLSQDQTKRIQDRRGRIVELLDQIRESLDLIESLRTSIAEKHSSYDSICGNVQSAASPAQIVKFLVWLKKKADVLSGYIPNFTRNMHHTPNVELISSLNLSPHKSEATSVDNQSE